MTDTNLLLLTIFLPLIAGTVSFLLAGTPKAQKTLVLFVTAFVFFAALYLYKKQILYFFPLGVFGWEFSVRLYPFSSFMVLSAVSMAFLISIYSVSFISAKGSINQFFSYLLLTLGTVNGAVLSNNLLFMFFFWEAILLVIFGSIILGGKNSYKTGIKAFIIVGVSDLCMMVGLLLAGHLAGTFTISDINLEVKGLGMFAFIFLAIGAVSKAGSMPFHSWIPDAADDAPLPFMALFPASLEKIIGIYFLTRICVDLFVFSVNSVLSFVLMIVGAVTLILAVCLALIQKDYKKLLSYHAISQVGYMILGIGTAVPAGIIGGIFHMINNVFYKTGLFLTAGSVEKQTGTTDLRGLGGLGRKMPVTFMCFFICALSISGVPPFNGFFSKEMIYDAALKRNVVFYIIAVLGSFFTAASFIKLGHAVYLGSRNNNGEVKESTVLMYMPMITLSTVCVLIGLFSGTFINKVIVPGIMKEGLFEGHLSVILVSITVFVLAGAFLNHYIGFKKTGSGLKAVDHMHNVPGLSFVYKEAGKKYSDPYEGWLVFINLISKGLWQIDRAVDWIYENFSVRVVYVFSDKIRRMHSRYYTVYLVWAIAGAVMVLFFTLK